jgi:hypothetical protein
MIIIELKYLIQVIKKKKSFNPFKREPEEKNKLLNTIILNNCS